MIIQPLVKEKYGRDPIKSPTVLSMMFPSFPARQPEAAVGGVPSL